MSDSEPKFHETLEADLEGTILLETVPRQGFEGKTLLFSNPATILHTGRTDEVVDVLAEMDEWVGKGYHVAGYLKYEAGHALQADRQTQSESPLIWFGIYDDPIEFSRESIDSLFSERNTRSPLSTPGRFALDRSTYTSRIHQIKHHIREGDVYQINFTAPYVFPVESTPLDLYGHLRSRQRVDYAAYIRTGEGHILSLSPELFFERRRNVITARPMKGTARRGQTELEDARLREMLSQDAKNRAENLMIVDLIRNDLSRVCEPGSIKVPWLFDTELYETVIQMTSTVTGRLRSNASYSDIFQSIFPSGSITGAPKKRAMEIISNLEESPRGVYCGSVGYISPKEEAVFNVAIRTIEISDGTGRMGIGSGIVWDSVAKQEFDECLLKASFLGDTLADVEANVEPAHAMAGMKIIETMRLDGTIELLDFHMQRIMNSAAFFDYPIPHQAMLSDLLSLSNSTGPARVRLTLDEDGNYEITSRPLDSIPEIHRLTISNFRVDPSNVYLFYKTTRREQYDQDLADARRAGFDEVLYLNSRGEIAEGAMSNIFVEIDDELLTPPVSSGLLPGVFRKHVLRTNARAREEVLMPDDLRKARQLYICNAVRGLRKATLADVSALSA